MASKVRYVLYVVLIAAMVYVAGCTAPVETRVTLDVSAQPLEKLSQYGFFKGSLRSLSPNDRVLPYELITPLFTDYAYKSRFVYMPEGKTVAYQTDKVLQLPVGACLIKNFYYPADFRKPDENKRIIETRMLVHRQDGWDALEYVWNDEQTDAKLEVAGDVKSVSWIHYDGSKKNIDYLIPNKKQCKSCHWLDGAVTPIGPKVRNLNRENTYTDGRQNQLAKLSKAGFMTGMPPLSTCPKIANYLDSAATINDRARAYIDVNCAHCHNAGGPAYTSGLYLNYEMQDREHLGFCKTPVSAGRGTGGLDVDILPGDPAHSIMRFRMASTDPGIKMPEIGRSVVHQEGLDLITRWIAEQTGSCKAN